MMGFSFDLKREGRGGQVTKWKQMRTILVTCFTGDWVFKWCCKDQRRIHFYKLAWIPPKRVRFILGYFWIFRNNKSKPITVLLSEFLSFPNWGSTWGKSSSALPIPAFLPCFKLCASVPVRRKPESKLSKSVHRVKFLYSRAAPILHFDWIAPPTLGPGGGQAHDESAQTGVCLAGESEASSCYRVEVVSFHAIKSQ